MINIFGKIFNANEPDTSKARQQPAQVAPISKPDESARSMPPVKSAQDEARRIKEQAEEEARKVRQEVLALETRLAQKEEDVDQKLQKLEEQERALRQAEEHLQGQRTEINNLKQDLVTRLEKVSSLTREEARNLMLASIEERLADDVAKRIKEAEEKIKRESEKLAKQILADAMLHGATDYVPEFTVSLVKLADEEMKGRIIGKEGRNIRAFEQATGVDVDLDEEGIIRLSSFDPVRREIAKVALEKLIRDTRIQPSRIEEVVAQTTRDIDRTIHQEGEKLCHVVGVYNLPGDLVNMLGRFKYRFSYGQSLIAHTLEETKIGIAIAQELKADVNVVKLGCLFHDIGKIVTDEEGTHVQLGVDLLKKYHIPDAVVACVAEHHEDRPFSSVESMIVYIADAISGSRPGARHENVEEYIKRMTDLENIAKSFKGVKEAYALSAGREVRVAVVPEEVDDNQAVKLAHDIADRVNKEVMVPGNVKITVVREIRAQVTTSAHGPR
ncbi:ribonuclease Y [Candidatus Daviesbacteria bacterium]|nr:ribonuclease Y [Candidatus Daviesbacteria bacterium]